MRNHQFFHVILVESNVLQVKSLESRSVLLEIFFLVKARSSCCKSSSILMFQSKSRFSHGEMPMLMMFINQSDDPIYIPNITLVESHVLLDISNQTPLWYWRVPGYKFNFLSGFPYLPSYIPSFHIPSCKYCNGCGCHPSWARRSFSERVPDEVLHIYASSDLKWYIYMYIYISSYHRSFNLLRL